MSRQSLSQTEWRPTDEQASRFIILLEDSILKQMEAIESLTKERDFQQDLVDKANEKLKELNKTLKADESALEYLSALRSGKVPSKVLTTTSHSEIKIKKSIRISWSEYTLNILNDAGRFMKTDELLSTLEARHLEVANIIKGNPKGRGYIKANLIKTLEGNKAFVSYHEKYGLKEWLDNGIPKPNYMKEFMFHS